jgi:hypothetical protein
MKSYVRKEIGDNGFSGDMEMDPVFLRFLRIANELESHAFTEKGEDFQRSKPGNGVVDFMLFIFGGTSGIQIGNVIIH